MHILSTGPRPPPLFLLPRVATLSTKPTTTKSYRLKRPLVLQLTTKNHFSEFGHYLLPVWAVQREGRKICLWSLEGWNIQFLFLIPTWYHNVWNLVWCQEKDAFEKRSTGWSPRPTPSSSSSSRRSSLQWWRLWGGVEKNAYNYSFVSYFCPTCLRLLNWETQRCHEPLAGWGTLRSAIWGDKNKITSVMSSSLWRK